MNAGARSAQQPVRTNLTERRAGAEGGFGSRVSPVVSRTEPGATDFSRGSPRRGWSPSYVDLFSATAADRPSARSSRVSSLNRSSWRSLNSVTSLASTASKSSSSRRKLR